MPWLDDSPLRTIAQNKKLTNISQQTSPRTPKKIREGQRLVNPKRKRPFLDRDCKSTLFLRQKQQKLTKVNALAGKRFQAEPGSRLTANLENLSPNEQFLLSPIAKHLRKKIPDQWCDPEEVQELGRSPGGKHSIYGTPSRTHRYRLFHFNNQAKIQVGKKTYRHLISELRPLNKPFPTTVTHTPPRKKQKRTPLNCTLDGHKKALPLAPKSGLQVMYYQIRLKSATHFPANTAGSNKAVTNNYSAKDGFSHHKPEIQGQKEIAHRVAIQHLDNYHINVLPANNCLNQTMSKIDFLTEFTGLEADFFINAKKSTYDTQTGRNIDLIDEVANYFDCINGNFDGTNSQVSDNVDFTTRASNTRDLLPEEFINHLGKKLDHDEAIEVKQVILFDRDPSNSFYIPIPRNKFYIIKYQDITLIYTNYPQCPITPAKYERHVNNAIANALIKRKSSLEEAYLSECKIDDTEITNLSEYEVNDSEINNSETDNLSKYAINDSDENMIFDTLFSQDFSTTQIHPLPSKINMSIAIDNNRDHMIEKLSAYQSTQSILA